jgi:hypothetical protein
MPAVATFGEFTKTNQKPQKQAFQVSPSYQPILKERKREVEQRLHSSKALRDLGDPELSASNIHYEISHKATGLSCGGVGVVHQMVNKLGLAQAIDERLRLLAIHKPYHESDHVLSVAYNILAGGNRLEDLELRRQDLGYMNSLGARRLPDPTTVGDFTRRFSRDDVLTLQEAINEARQRVWQHRRSVEAGFLEKALIDVDGTICGTLGECKQGMSMSYKGVWGYHVLLVTLANTREVLYCVNRPGNVASNEGNAAWLDRAIELVRPHSAEIILRGDTDFSNCPHLDRWHEEAVNFIFGMDAHAKVVATAEALPESAWEPLERPLKYVVATHARQKPENIKEQVVIAKGYTNLKLRGECVAEFNYQPVKCGRAYRMIVVRKNISVIKGEEAMIDEVRYFFYITNMVDQTKEEMVRLANGRGDQENIIEQAKNGVRAMNMPVNDLVSNWAYMSMALLAWNLKAWYALILPDMEAGKEVAGMEMRRFLQQYLMLPAQIVRTGRRVIFRIMTYNDSVGWLLELWAKLWRWRPQWG